MAYLRTYGTGSRQNERKSLKHRVDIAQLSDQVRDSRIRSELQALPTGPDYRLWDFGARASKFLQLGAHVYIKCHDTLYSGKIVLRIVDRSGKIGDALGWHRIQGVPWRNPAVLGDVRVLSEDTTTVTSRYPKRAELIPNFYKME